MFLVVVVVGCLKLIFVHAWRVMSSFCCGITGYLLLCLSHVFGCCCCCWLSEDDFCYAWQVMSSFFVVYGLFVVVFVTCFWVLLLVV